MGPYGGWGNMNSPPLGLRMGPLWEPCGPCRGPMEPYGGWGNMNSPPLGLRMGPLWEPSGPCRGPMEPYGALRGLGQYELAPPGA